MPPTATPHCAVHYVGTLEDGTKFDSSRDRGDPFAFKLGQGAPPLRRMGLRLLQRLAISVARRARRGRQQPAGLSSLPHPAACAGNVIKGWDTAVATMKKGETSKVVIRSDYGYGESGSPPKIPGGATLVFEIELLSWKSIKDVNGERGRLQDSGGSEPTAGLPTCGPPPARATLAGTALGAAAAAVCRAGIHRPEPAVRNLPRLQATGA